MIKTREELRKLREIYAASLGEEDKKILICAGTGCISSGSLEIYDELKKIMEERGINVAVELREEPHEHSVGLKKSGLPRLLRDGAAGADRAAGLALCQGQARGLL